MKLFRKSALPQSALLYTLISSIGLAWTPGTGSPSAVAGFVVNPLNRTDVLSFYHTVYTASENYAANMAYTGSVAGGVAGTTSAGFKDDVRRRINFYRALSGLPGDIVFDSTKSSKDQQAALMFARNNDIDHFPPANWFYYNANAAEAAANSNIALGTYGPGSVDAYMRDDGGNNIVVGHRRWFHYSRAQQMGTGDVPSQSPYNRTNAIWVIGNFKSAPPPQFVAWPNRGYVPLGLVPARWSLSYPNANFSNANVTMTQGATNVPINIISNNDNGYGDNSLVWTPENLPASINADKPYTVTVTNIGGAGVPATYTYPVTLFDPDVLGESATITGSSTPPSTGANYTFNSITQADAYELNVATGSTTAWIEGAEDSTASQVTSATTGVYPLRQTAVVRTGAKAFQLAFADFTDQSFTLTRDVIPSATSSLQFYDRGRFATNTSTLHAEISTDSGNTWTSVWSRNGVGLNSGLFDSAFISRNVSLAAYAGQILRIRFIFRWNGQSITTGTSSNHGFFIDDVTVTNATQLVTPTTTPLSGATSGFTLNASTAGAPLVTGTSYYLRVRPNVGTRWFAFGALKIATVQPPSGYAAWLVNQYPAVTGGLNGDHEKDGFSNGVEYAFGMNPLVPNPGSAVPQPTRVGNTYAVTFNQPAGVSGLTYGAQWSRNLVNWFPVPDTGSGGTHTFTVHTPGEPKIFFRYNLTFNTAQ